VNPQGCEITDSLLTLDLSPGFILTDMSGTVHIDNAAKVAGVRLALSVRKTEHL
jgi:hypothetical protein